ncbi:MAG: NUDIX hydrolase [Rhodobacteraceae bacterium]|nr:NUDIX hydrolase [Paracoccaceae bacterium]
MRRYGAPVRRDRTYRPRPGVYAILLRGNRVLLTHQSTPRPEFQLPGGGVDPGESPIAALHREVYEETGWRIAAPRRIMPHRRFTYMPEYDMWAEKICSIFLARPVLRRGPPAEQGHIAVWVPAALAADMVASPGDRAALLTVLGA